MADTRHHQHYTRFSSTVGIDPEYTEGANLIDITDLGDDGHAAQPVNGQVEQTVPSSPSVSSIKELITMGKELGLEGKELQSFVQGERDKEREHEREASRLALEERKDERQENERNRLFRIEELRIQSEVQMNTNGNAAHPSQPSHDHDPRFIPKIPYLDDKDDVESWLKQFEHYARDMNLDESKKASRLIYFLKGKARTIVSKMDDEDVDDYEKVKSALFEGFQLTAEQYRMKFRNTRRNPAETYKEHITRLDRYLTKWIELDPCEKTVKGLTDLILREQSLQSMPSDLAVHVKDRNPINAKEMGKLASDYELNRSQNRLRPTPTRTPQDGTKRFEKDHKPSPQQGKRSSLTPAEREKLREAGLCFYCRVGLHRSSDCPLRKKGNTAGAVTVEDVRRETQGRKSPLDKLCRDCTTKKFSDLVDVKVNGKRVTALRDSGCSSIVVAAHLVPADKMTGQRKRTTLADKSKVRYCETAIIHVDSPFFCGETEVVVMADPIMLVLIGEFHGTQNDRRKTPIFPVREPTWYHDSTETVAGAVDTRAQSKLDNDRDKSASKPSSREPTSDMFTPKDLREAQKTDPSLDSIRKQAATGEERGHMRVVEKNGILYQSTFNRKGEESLKVILPKSFRSKVLAFGHDHPMAGHQGQRRTAERIRREFWWPCCGVEIRRYCLSCDACQRSAPKHLTKKVPLGKMPVFETAFRRVAVDIIGPILPMSENKKRYILVMVDFATRYPEAVALKDIHAETVADALWDFWTRLGIPSEILTDNGSQFTGTLMQEVTELLRIKRKTSAVFHPAGNGLCERMNGTLKNMLKKMCIEQPKAWDTFISALLFAYRETPQESLGFSPFELLFGRTVRGPMQLLRQIWTDESVSDEVKTTAEYVVNLRERIEETCLLARENLKKASVRSAQYYDRKAKPRSLKPGEKVLILKPLKTNKLELTWQGPFEVLEKLNDFDYKVQVRRKEKVFHVNLLKSYVEREQPVTDGTIPVAVVEEEEEEVIVSVVVEEDETTNDDIFRLDSQRTIPTFETKRTEGLDHVHFSEKLTQTQRTEARQICADRLDNLTDVPLTTNLTTCRIEVTDKKPVYIRPRPIPHAYVKMVENEVEEMLKLGVIEPANSAYNSPIVLVKKKEEGKYRFCADLRGLNDVTVFDGEPITDVQHLFQSLGKAKYFSKLDLTRGYWGIPIVEEDRDKTAFVTSRGQFRWVNMPFGLKTATGIFNRMMRKLLGPLNRDDVYHFMDDILIATETWEQHMEALKAVLQRLKEANLAAKPSKCYIGFDQLPYLGHEIGHGERWPEDDKIVKIVNAKEPATKKQLRAFLGLTGFYREYLENYSTVVVPLTDMTKKSLPDKLKWSDEAKKSFARLKRMVSEKPVLKMPDFGKDFVLRTDASDRGIGAVLMQLHGEKLHPVAYQSKKLLGAESRYATVEKECLATVWGVQKFERYLYGRHFVLETDHQPLKCLQRNPTNPRLLRWSLQLQPYSFTINYIPGKDNLGADYLSRIN
ncbi:uncharacterized protein [Littorina saxatilis]|uniref:Reverse transcriptase n=1 Tax=Littorina saxatilis TaxID=31220 RepID=A0AAN9BRG7_9CAEN